MSDNQHSPLHRGEGPADRGVPGETARTESVNAENNETRVLRRQSAPGATEVTGEDRADRTTEVPASTDRPRTIRGERAAARGAGSYAGGPYEGEPYAGEAAQHEVLDKSTFNARARERFGGVKAGSAFFGWLTATGMAVLLTALAAATGLAVSLSTNTTVEQAANNANAGTVGITGAIVLAVILFVAYYCGGYVAGRMARFNGARQGVAVWLWALVMAALVAVLGAVFGNRFNVFANLNSFPRIPINEGDVTTVGIVAVIIAALVALVGAVLGGLAGMRFHRRVDRAGFEERYVEDDDERA